MAKLSVGDRVQIVTRDATVEDARESRYFTYFGGLTGTIQKLTGSEAAVEIDLDALRPEMRERHHASEKRMHERWMANLSEDARSKLIPQEREFHLTYTLLVALADLAPFKGEKPAKPAEKPSIAKTEAKGATPTAEQQKDELLKRAEFSRSSPEADDEEIGGLFDTPPRITTADLDHAEEEFLKKREQK